jgi:hypothetical protein
MEKRYHLVEHILPKAAITDNGNSSTSTDIEHPRSSKNINSNKTFPVKHLTG